tara:strand:- start:422 stop:1039 length:618 start_codon:yes stop_codon:yes gene_type:complete
MKMLGCIKIFILTITIFFIVNYLIFENLVPKELILNYILEKFDLKIPHFPTIPKTIILENNDKINQWKFTHFNQTHYETINEKNLLKNIKIFNDNLEKIQGGNINLIYNCGILIFSFILGIFLNVIGESVRLIYPIESTNRKIDIHIINYNQFSELIKERFDFINERFDNINQLTEIINHRLDCLQTRSDFLHDLIKSENINSSP